MRRSHHHRRVVGQHARYDRRCDRPAWRAGRAGARHQHAPRQTDDFRGVPGQGGHRPAGQPRQRAGERLHAGRAADRAPARAIPAPQSDRSGPADGQPALASGQRRLVAGETSPPRAERLRRRRAVASSPKGKAMLLRVAVLRLHYVPLRTNITPTPSSANPT